MLQNLRARDVFYGILVLMLAGCVSCSTANKPSLRGLLDEMAGNCGANGTALQKAKPSEDANEEIKAEVEVHCFPPAHTGRIFYGT
jgi:hypothetical protein